MLLPHAPEIALAEVGGEERAALEEQAARIPTAEVVRMIEALGDSLSRTKRGGDPKLELELTFLKLARDYAEPSVDALLGRLETLENAVANGVAAASVPAVSSREEEAESENAERDAPAEAATSEASLYVGEDRGDGESEAAGPGQDPAREDGRDETIEAVVAQWGRIIQDLKDRKQALTATVFAEGMPSNFQDGVLEIAFPKESDFYVREAAKSRHGEALGEVLERRFGMRPRLELRVVSTDGSASADYPRPQPPVEGANGDASTARTSRDDFFGVAPEPAPEPEDATTQPGISEGADDTPLPEDESGTEAGESVGADDTIQDQWEVLSMARELFGPGEGTSGAEQSRGG
jgi:DNA polymerase-3 subunit gamma/tau